jgi:hypothetical protein
MSWSISKTMGVASAVRAAVEPDFDRAAKSYAGTPEEADVVAAKTSVLAWLDKKPEGSGVIVEASGSRGDGWLSVKIDCHAVPLKL